MNDLQRAVLETTATRDRAEALLEGLLRARSECETVRKHEGRPDLMTQVRGASSLDDAIEATKRMIAELDAAARRGRDHLRAAGQDLIDARRFAAHGVAHADR